MARQTFRGSFEPNGQANPTNVVGDCVVYRTDEGKFKIVLPSPFPVLVCFWTDMMAGAEDEASLMNTRFCDGLGHDGKTMWIHLYKTDGNQCICQDSVSNTPGSVMIAFTVFVDDTPLIATNIDVPNEGQTSVVSGGSDGSFIV
jgi:hypothetical protein